MAETMTKKQLENSEIQTGACHYCGQVYQFETDGRATEEQLDAWAAEKRDCIDAITERMRRQRADLAKEKREELLDKNFMEEREVLYKAIDLMVQDKIVRTTVDIGNGIKLSVGMNAKGSIKTEITQTKKRSAET